jgi:hypothetical protein
VREGASKINSINLQPRLIISSFIFLICILSLTFLASMVNGETGVKQGDWATYNAHFRYSVNDTHSPEINIYEDYDYTIQIDVTDTPETNITFTETLYEPNDINYSYTITGDPSKPYDDHPLVEVNHFFLPTGMSPGDLVPEPQIDVDVNGSLFSIPFATMVNETVNMNVSGVPREVNHVEWVQTTGGVGDDQRWTQRIEHEAYYDRETGMLLDLFSNTTKMYYALNGVTWETINEVHVWKMRDSSILGVNSHPSTEDTSKNPNSVHIVIGPTLSPLNASIGQQVATETPQQPEPGPKQTIPSFLEKSILLAFMVLMFSYSFHRKIRQH